NVKLEIAARRAIRHSTLPEPGRYVLRATAHSRRVEQCQQIEAIVGFAGEKRIARAVVAEKLRFAEGGRVAATRDSIDVVLGIETETQLDRVCRRCRDGVVRHNQLLSGARCQIGEVRLARCSAERLRRWGWRGSRAWCGARR